MFPLGPDVSYDKRTLHDGSVAYVFRHRELGDLGRVIVQARGETSCQCTAEVCGDPSDPMTEKRREIFAPLGTALLQQFEEAYAQRGIPATLDPPPPSLPPDRSSIESKIIVCEQCNAPVAQLIFADNASAPGYLEDYARLMYPQYSRVDVPTWIIGPPLGDEPPPERAAELLQVWPTRGVKQRLSPAEFNPQLEALATGHCK
jgi:hypothetical protein